MLAWAKYSALVAMVALTSLTSCQRSSSPIARAGDAPPRYGIECPVGEACNPSVALLVGLSAPSEPMRCTAALVGSRTAVTAGHCVAWELSLGGACEDIWLGFASTEGGDSEWIGCQRIAAVISSPGSLLSPDYAVLELASDVSRPAIPLGEGEVEVGEVVEMVSVTADRFYDDVHEVRSRRCIVEEGGVLAPFATSPPDTVRVLSSCPIREGSSGSPILDSAGRMRGLVHAGGPRFFAFGLMTLLPQPVEREDG